MSTTLKWVKWWGETKRFLIHFSWCTHDKWFIIFNVNETDVPRFKISSYIGMRCVCSISDHMCVCGWAVGPGSVWPAWDKENGQSFPASMKYCTCVCVCVCVLVRERVTRFSSFSFVCFFSMPHKAISFHWTRHWTSLYISALYCCCCCCFIPIEKVLFGQQQQQQPKISQLEI